MSPQMKAARLTEKPSFTSPLSKTRLLTSGALERRAKQIELQSCMHIVNEHTPQKQSGCKVSGHCRSVSSFQSKLWPDLHKTFRNTDKVDTGIANDDGLREGGQLHQRWVRHR